MKQFLSILFLLSIFVFVEQSVSLPPLTRAGRAAKRAAESAKNRPPKVKTGKDITVENKHFNPENNKEYALEIRRATRPGVVNTAARKLTPRAETDFIKIGLRHINKTEKTNTPVSFRFRPKHKGSSVKFKTLSVNKDTAVIQSTEVVTAKNPKKNPTITRTTDHHANLPDGDVYPKNNQLKIEAPTDRNRGFFGRRVPKRFRSTPKTKTVTNVEAKLVDKKTLNFHISHGFAKNGDNADYVGGSAKGQIKIDDVDPETGIPNEILGYEFSPMKLDDGTPGIQTTVYTLLGNERRYFTALPDEGRVISAGDIARTRLMHADDLPASALTRFKLKPDGRVVKIRSADDGLGNPFTKEAGNFINGHRVEPPIARPGRPLNPRDSNSGATN